MSFWEDAVNTVERKSEEVIKISKLKFRLSAIKNELNACYGDLGRYVYQMRKKGADDEEYETSLIDKISRLQQDLSEVAQQLNRTKGVRPCAQCGHVNEVSSEFCSQCGAGLNW